MPLRHTVFPASLLAVVLCGTTPQAQTSLSGVLAVPTGDFSSDNHASVGFGATLEHNSQIGTGPLGWVSSLGFTFNPSDKSDFEEGLEAEGGNFLNFPALTGLRFNGGDGPVRFYAQGQIGLQLFMITDMTASDGTQEATMTTDANIHLGFGGGVGFILNEKFHAGFRYYQTPELEMSSTVSDDTESIDLEGELTVSMIQFHVGIVF